MTKETPEDFNFHNDDVTIQAQIDGEPLLLTEEFQPSQPGFSGSVRTARIDDYRIRQREPFQKALERLINFHSIENASNTPDFILAKFLVVMHDAYMEATREREVWYGQELSIGGRVESNFEFYVDGYTLKSTGTVGQVQVTTYDGRSTVIKSKSLTDFLERRLDTITFDDDEELPLTDED